MCTTSIDKDARRLGAVWVVAEVLGGDNVMQSIRSGSYNLKFSQKSLGSLNGKLYLCAKLKE